MRETTSLPRLTAAALSRALNLEQGSRLLTVRLPGAIDCKALRECFSLNSNGVPDICELEPGRQGAGNGDALLRCLTTHRGITVRANTTSKKNVSP